MMRDDEGQTKRTPVKTGSSPVSCLTFSKKFGAEYPPYHGSRTTKRSA